MYACMSTIYMYCLNITCHPGHNHDNCTWVFSSVVFVIEPL